MKIVLVNVINVAHYFVKIIKKLVQVNSSIFPINLVKSFIRFS